LAIPATGAHCFSLGCSSYENGYVSWVHSKASSTMLLLVRKVPLLLLFLALPCLPLVVANTEKIIFVAPPKITLPNVRPGLENLCLDTLKPNDQNSLQTQLPVAFPSEQHPRGLQSWYILEGLTPGQRYETRICWVTTVGYLHFANCLRSFRGLAFLSHPVSTPT
jgi:hypothetical protein